MLLHNSENGITFAYRNIRTMAKFKQPNLYYVDWYTEGGFCYRTTSNCTWADVLACKRQAKWLGETIKYSRMN